MVKATPTHDELIRDWRIIGNTVRGASHSRTNTPNQDHILGSDRINLAYILAISDGHGGEKYFRSNKGSQYAVEVAITELEGFAEQFSSVEDTARIKRKASELPERIVKQWRARVDADLKENLKENRFFTDEEWLRFSNGKALPDISDPLLPYGATLLTVLIARTFILCLQLGDGDIVFVKENGEPTKPIESDARLLANETTSLCMPKAAQDFRQKFYRLQNVPPALIMLSTDGYANSFNTQEGFLKVGADILDMMRTDGIDSVEKNVEGWLTAATNQGSGDDITLGLLCRLSALKPSSPSMEGSPAESAQEEEVQHAPEEQRSVIPAGSLQEGHGRFSSSPEMRPDSFDDEQTIMLDRAMLPTKKQEQQSTSLRDFGNPARPPDQRHEQMREAGTEQYLIVSQSGRGDCTTISEALERAGPSMKIRVEKGKYREALRIDKDVELLALGEVTIEYEVPCLKITAQRAHVENFRIRGECWSENTRREMGAVEIRSGASQLVACDISSHSLCGVNVSGATTNPQLKFCRIHSCQRKGIVFDHEAKGLLENCIIESNNSTGVVLAGRSAPYLRTCTISHGIEGGIYIDDDAEAVVEDSTISDNFQGGLSISHGKLTLHGCKVLANGSYGLLLQKEAVGKLRECEVEGSSYGVVVLSSNATIQGGSITSQKQMPALIFAEASVGNVDGCKIVTQVTAVRVRKYTSLTLRECSFSSKGVDLDIKYNNVVTVELDAYQSAPKVVDDGTSKIKCYRRKVE